jgi:hypothetical protein
VQKEIVEAHPKANFVVYVVWMPMIPTDSEAAARKSGGMYQDRRLRQYYDPQRLVGIAFSRDLKLDQFQELLDSLSDEDPLEQRIREWFSMPPEERPVWDAMYFFPAGVRWTEALPEPATWTKQLGFFGDQPGDEPSGLFFRHDSKQPPSESDWFVEVRQAIAKLIAPVASTDSSPVRCALTPEQLDSRRDQLLPRLIERAKEVTEVKNGVRLQFDNSVGLLAELAKVVDQERSCCSFLRFQITTEPENGPVFFDVTGPPGTPELLRSLVSP